MLLSDARFTSATSGYVLGWQNVRPAPKVTIDFGNGKRLERTLKGSTIVYVCRPDGAVVDAYPGVYTADDFLSLLAETRPQQTRSPLQVLAWHRSQASTPALAAGPVELTASKAVVQAPLASMLENRRAAPSGEFSDMSALPVTRGDVAERLGLPPEASGGAIVAADSRRYRNSTRAATHRLIGGFQGLPTPDQCLKPLFKDILKVPIDDPYLGLKDESIPGTP